MPIKDKAHHIEYRVYYEDTDAGGVVYHANYLQFAERARTEFLRELGYKQTELREGEKKLFVVKAITADYHKPGRLDDMFEVVTTLESLANSSMVMLQKVVRESEVLCDIRAVVICINTDTMRPTRIPEAIKADIGEFVV